MNVRILGVDALSKALKQKSRNMTPAIQRVVRKHGAALQQKEMRTVPVGTPQSTGIKGYVGGTLKRSITLDISGNGRTAIVEPTAHYAAYVEYGTRYMNAQPYVRPSYNAQVTLFKADLNNLVK